MHSNEEITAPVSRLIDEKMTDEKISDESGTETITDLALRPAGLMNPFWK